MKVIGRGLHTQVLTGSGRGMKVERFLKAIGTATVDGSHTITVGIAIGDAMSITSPAAAYGPAYGTPTAGAPVVHVHVTAFDSKSVTDHSPAIAKAVYMELNKGGALSQRIKSTVLG